MYKHYSFLYYSTESKFENELKIAPSLSLSLSLSLCLSLSLSLSFSLSHSVKKLMRNRKDGFSENV